MSLVMSLRAVCPANWIDADRHGEEEEHARHGEERQQAEDQRLRLIAAEEAQAQDRADQHAGQKQDPADMAGTVGTVDGRALWRVALVSHGISLSPGTMVIVGSVALQVCAPTVDLSDHATRNLLIDL